MSVLACVTVHECDGCGKTLALKTDRDYTSFEATWYEGLSVDFCPMCRDLPKFEMAIMGDRAKRHQIANYVKRSAAEAAAPEVRNAAVH